MAELNMQTIEFNAEYSEERQALILYCRISNVPGNYWQQIDATVIPMTKEKADILMGRVEVTTNEFKLRVLKEEDGFDIDMQAILNLPSDK